jgi:hypothetical protein
MPPRKDSRSLGQGGYEFMAENDRSADIWVEWREVSPAMQARWETAVVRFSHVLQEREAAEADEEPPRRAPLLRVPPARPQP